VRRDRRLAVGRDELIDEGPSSRFETSDGSRLRMVPAAALRGLAKSGSPASSRSWFILLNAARGK
jgi:hypothetical protein